jgi:hypothetical protein
MSVCVAIRIGSALTFVALFAATAPGYIHVPPMTLAKMCKVSHQIRALKVDKFNKEKGGIVFECAETIKDGKSKITSFKLFVRTEATGTKPILDWVKEGKQAVMFSIEGQNRGAMRAIAYVFIDDYCFSADHNAEGKFWLVLRGEPGMSACYHGPVEKLRGLVKDVLDGKEVKVPVKGPDVKEDRDKRNKEVNDALKENRSFKP